MLSHKVTRYTKGGFERSYKSYDMSNYASTGACNLGIWSVNAGAKLTAQEHAESADRKDILLGIAKGNLFACSAKWTTQSSSTILAAQSVRNF